MIEYIKRMLAELKGDKEAEVKKETEVPVLSGSVEVEEVVEAPPEMVNEIMEKILSLTWDKYEDVLTSNVAPTYMLKSEKSEVWLYSLTRMNYFPVRSDSIITPLDDMEDLMSKCTIGTDMYEVDTEMIEEVGWN